MPKNILIIGASRGLGFSLVQGLLPKVQKIFTVSRTKLDLEKLQKTQNLEISKIVEIHCDLSKTQNLSSIYQTIDKISLDLIIYNTGIWENIDFESESDEILENIITVNLTSAILILKNLLPNLKKSQKANVVLIGSTAGLENFGSLGVSYVASKFGLRVLAHILRGNLRKDEIGITVLNLGGMATNFDLNESDKVLAKYGNAKIPVALVFQNILWIVNLSKAICPKEVDLPSMLDETV